MTDKVIISRLEDLPPVPCTLGGMEWNPTGLWRYLTPTPRDKAAPCGAACPAGNPLPEVMARLAQGRADAALAALLENNPLPGVTGRLCYHPCQRDCLRAGVDRALPLQTLERWLADHGQVKARPSKARGARVAVLGAGPAGLTCAYLLGRQGLRISLFDPAPQAGGFLRGAKGLPASVLSREVRRLKDLGGIEMILGQAAEPGLRGSAFDLVVLDSTAHSKSSPEAKALADWAQAVKDAPLLRVEAKGFKTSQVAHAVALGQELAARARAMLAGEEYAPPPDMEVVEAQAIKLDRFAPEKPRKKPPARLDAARAAHEAGRCMSCGRCNQCQECVLYCPDACLALEGRAIKVDLAHCKGCGICAQECPRGVISMQAEAGS